MSYTVTIEDIKNLREITFAGIKDTKQALIDAEGNFDRAIEILKERRIIRGNTNCSRDRETKEGKAIASMYNGIATIVKLKCETDFVANTTDFKNAIVQIENKVQSSSDLSNIQDEILTPLAGKLGEVIALELEYWTPTSNDYVLGIYTHGNEKLAVIVEAEKAISRENLKALAMHIAAYNPMYFSSSELPQHIINKELELNSSKLVGKPENIQKKITEGIVNKLYSEYCLDYQPWIHDDKKTVAQAIGCSVKRFVIKKIG